MSQPSVELLMLGGGLGGGQWQRDGQSCKSTVEAKNRRRIVKRSRVNVRWSEEEENCIRQSTETQLCDEDFVWGEIEGGPGE